MDLLQKIHNSFGHIRYYDDKHIYQDTRNSRILVSVTTEIKKYKEPFQSDFWSLYKAFQASGYYVKSQLKDYSGFFVNGVWYDFEQLKKATKLTVTQADIQKNWAKIKEEGTRLGSQIHLYAQDGLERRFPSRSHYTPMQTMVNQFLHENYFCDSPGWMHIKSELVVGNRFLGGQIDNLSIKLATNGLWVRDYKTDKEIKYENPFQKLKGPLSHLDDCNKNKYDIQVSIYRKIMEEAGILIEGQEIVWFDKINMKWQIIPSIYYKKEAEVLCAFESKILN